MTTGTPTGGPEIVDALSDEVEAVETELGLSPSGAEATVAARFARIDQSDPAAGTAGLRTLGAGATQAASGAHLHAIYLLKAGDTMSGTLTLASITPTGQFEAASKGYVDSIAMGLAPKEAVRAATAAVLPFSPGYNNGSSGVGATLLAGSVGVLTVDGVTIGLNERVLVKDQTDATQNGVYQLSTVGTAGIAYILTRTTDADTPGDLSGMYTYTQAGTANIAGTSFILTTPPPPIIIGSSNITYAQNSAGGGAAIPDGSITSAKIADGTIVAGDIAANTITSANILNATIVGGDIAVDTITAANIGADEITASEIAPLTITGAEIAASTIAGGKLVTAYIPAAEKGTASGVATLDTGTLVPRAQLGTQTPTASTALFGDGLWKNPASVSAPPMAWLIAAADSPIEFQNSAQIVIATTGTNCAATINTAITSATNGGVRGATITFAPGTYAIGQPGIILRSFVTLRGSGRNSTIFVSDSNTSIGMFWLFNGFTHCFSVRDLFMEGNGNGGGTCNGFWLDNRADIAHGGPVAVTNFQGTTGGDVPPTDFIVTDPAGQNFINDVTIHNFSHNTTTRRGIWMNGDQTGASPANSCETSRGMRIQGLVATNGCDGNFFEVDSASDGRLDNCHVGVGDGSATQDGFVIGAGNWRVTNCYAFFAGRDGFVFNSRVTALGAVAQDCGRNGILISSEGEYTGLTGDSNSRSDVTGANIRIEGSNTHGAIHATSTNRGSAGTAQRGFSFANGLSSLCVIGSTAGSGGAPLGSIPTPVHFDSAVPANRPQNSFIRITVRGSAVYVLDPP